MEFTYLLIHTDTPEWDDQEYLFFPSFVLGAAKQLIPVICGKPDPEFFNDGRGSYGIYVKEEYYDKIDFGKPLIFFHEGDITEIPGDLVNDIVERCKDEVAVSDHVHVNQASQGDLIQEGDFDGDEEDGYIDDESGYDGFLKGSRDEEDDDEEI